MTDENASPIGITPRDKDALFRKPLGNVSPNLGSAHRPNTLGPSKPLLGSPLKRSFTAALGDQGFTYLKRRKLSLENTLESPSGRTEKSAEPANILNDENLASLPNVSEDPNLPYAVHPSPTEPNTPPSSLAADDHSHGSSAERKSFSSLINYDQSSQQATASQPAAHSAPRKPSYAELLRLRLRVAMYKVQTDQVEVPFCDLRIEGELDLPTADNDVSNDDPTAESVEANAATEPQAALSRSVAETRLLLGAGPRLTPYSRRMGFDARDSSPPPIIVLPEKLAVTNTPLGARIRAQDETELTSSIVKGRVAEGLLGLKNAV